MIMNATRHPVFALAAFAVMGLSAASQAAVLASYNFTTGATTQTIAATAVDPGVTAGLFSANGVYSTNIGISASGNAYLRSTTSEATQALVLADMAVPQDEYFQVTISADAGMVLNLTSLTFFLGHTTDNATSFTSTAVLSSNVNGFGTAITGAGGISRTTAATTGSAFNATEATFDLSAPTYQGRSTITFRLALYDDRNENGKITRFDDFTLNGTVIPEPSSALLGVLGFLALLHRHRD
jgi:hypothetical protein